MILVFGSTGQLALELRRLVPEAVFLGRDAVDLRDPEAVRRAIRAHGPRLVLNAAAYTAVDRAEEEEVLAHAVNALSPGAMAEEAAALGVPFVHVSTDYVFDGTGDIPRAEDAPTGPLGAYGRTKLAGEAAIAAAGGRWAVLRTSWVFSAHGQNFVKTMLRLGATRDRLTIVADQIGGPTPAAAIAQAMLQVGHGLENGAPSGLLHFSGAPDVSWAGFARAIFAQRGMAVEVVDIPTTDFPTPAQRPLNSRLDCRRIHDIFALDRPDWRAALDDVLKELP